MRTETIILSRPIKRGNDELTQITLREPNLIALRDIPINLLQLGQGDTLRALVPRISEPQLTETDLNRLSAPDLGKLSLAVASFFTDTASDQSEAMTETAAS